MNFVSDPPSPRILIAEDNYLMAEEVRDFVRDCGYAVAGSAPTVESGLALIARAPMEGAVLDIDLGGEPSYSICRALAAKGVPFAFLSGYSAPHRLIPPEFRDAPHLTKPFEPSQLKSILASMVGAPQPVTEAPSFGNTVLDSLQPEERALLSLSLERISLRAGERLEPPASPVAHVYFPTHGLLSLFAGDTAGTRIEVASVGNDGMTAPGLLLGDRAVASEVVVQVTGSAWRIAAGTLQGLTEVHSGLRRRLLEHSAVGLRKLVESAAYGARATIVERLARWLLNATNRLGCRQLNVTHEGLAEILGVRRPSVTVGLQTLEGRRLIRSTRRTIVVLDPEGLTALAERCRPVRQRSVARASTQR